MLYATTGASACPCCDHTHFNFPLLPPWGLQEMAAAGLEADAVAHTILLMAHEKAGGWEAALECYATMQRLGLQSNSFTYRKAVGCWEE